MPIQYILTLINPEDKEEMALTLNGRKNRLERIDFEQLGGDFGLSSKQIQGVFERFYKLKSTAIKWVDNSFLSNKMKTLYKEKMEERYHRIF